MRRDFVETVDQSTGIWRMQRELGLICGAPAPVWWIKRALAQWATVLLRDVVSDPPLEAIPHELKIDNGLSPRAMAMNQLRFASRTR